MDIDDQQAKKAVLVDNVLQKKLSDYELCLAIHDRLQDGTFSSQNDAAKMLGIHRKQIYRYLSFLALPLKFRKELDSDPELLGSNQADDLKNFLESHQQEIPDELVSDMFSLLRASKLRQNNIISWLTKALGPEAATVKKITPSIPWHGDGKSLGRIELSNNKLSISFDEKLIDGEVLLDAVTELLKKETKKMTYQ
jgi:ParB-like chromosome segregation protein Spo0J